MVVDSYTIADDDLTVTSQNLTLDISIIQGKITIYFVAHICHMFIGIIPVNSFTSTGTGSKNKIATIPSTYIGVYKSFYSFQNSIEKICEIEATIGYVNVCTSYVKDQWIYGNLTWVY